MRFSWLALALAVLTGCGKSTPDKKQSDEPSGILGGEVTLGGKVLAVGEVVVVGETRRVSGPIGPDGIYLIKDAPPGPVQLFLRLPPPLPGFNPATGKPLPGAKAPVDLSADELEAHKLAMQVPARYVEPGSSGLRTTVKKDDEVRFDIKMSR
jgi:hypothetical protein